MAVGRITGCDVPRYRPKKKSKPKKKLKKKSKSKKKRKKTSKPRRKTVVKKIVEKTATREGIHSWMKARIRTKYAAYPKAAVNRALKAAILAGMIELGEKKHLFKLSKAGKAAYYKAHPVPK